MNTGLAAHPIHLKSVKKCDAEPTVVNFIETISMPTLNFVQEEHMSSIVITIEVNVPVQAAYTQWTYFEEFPQFMEGVKQVTQLDAKRLHWKAEIAGKEWEWVAKIIEQTPYKRVAWTSRDGLLINGAMVTFHPLSDVKSKILWRVGHTTESLVKHMGDGLSAVSLRMQRDLKRFKTFIEQRGQEARTPLHGLLTNFPSMYRSGSVVE